MVGLPDLSKTKNDNAQRRIYYAHEAFPWANLPPSLTLAGFISQRWSSHRVQYAHVLMGSDDQLAGFIHAERLPAAAVNFNVPALADISLAFNLLPRFDEILEKGISLAEVKNYYHGWYDAGRRHEEE